MMCYAFGYSSRAARVDVVVRVGMNTAMKTIVRYSQADGAFLGKIDVEVR